MYVSGEYDFRRLGIRAAAARHGYGAQVGDGAPFFSAYSTRKAYILEVNRRMDSLWRDIYQSHAADDTFRAEFRAFMTAWQEFVAGLSVGGMLLPSTQEYAERVDQQIEEWRKRYEQLGGTVNMPGYMPPRPPSTPFPWKRMFTVVTVVAAVAGVIFVASKLPDVPGPRYA